MKMSNTYSPEEGTERRMKNHPVYEWHCYLWKKRRFHHPHSPTPSNRILASTTGRMVAVARCQHPKMIRRWQLTRWWQAMKTCHVLSAQLYLSTDTDWCSCSGWFRPALADLVALILRQRFPGRCWCLPLCRNAATGPRCPIPVNCVHPRWFFFPKNCFNF